MNIFSYCESSACTIIQVWVSGCELFVLLLFSSGNSLNHICGEQEDTKVISDDKQAQECNVMKPFFGTRKNITHLRHAVISNANCWCCCLSVADSFENVEWYLCHAAESSWERCCLVFSWSTYNFVNDLISGVVSQLVEPLTHATRAVRWKL